jgi:DNA-binding Xre family transcriptional regulator
MSEMNDLRSLVMSRKGSWTRLARLTGLSTKTLSRIASGATDDVRISTADKIRQAAMQIPAKGADLVEPPAAS